VQERPPADNEPAARPQRPAPEVETQMKPKRVALYGLGLLLLALLAGGGTLVMLTYQPGSATAMNTPEARYEHFRSWGDSLFALANYAAARDLYARALTARPKDVHATARMEEAEHMRMLTQDEAYARLRIRGDSLFARRSYMKALEAYRDALGKRPGDPVMLEKVQKAIERLLAASMRVPPAQPDAARSAPQPDVEPEPMALLPLQAPSAPLSEEQAELYRLARKQGDSLFILGNYSGARERFEDALRYQPADAYTAALVEEIDRIADEKVRDEQYRSSLEEGDALFDQKRLVEAQEAYERALELKPRDAAAASRLAEINNLLAQTQRKEDLYKYFRKQADGHLETGNYEVAISRYKKAMEYRPDDEYALRKIEEAEQALAAKRAQY
jgi:tetratricopeptide (TPR) repeat protein